MLGCSVAVILIHISSDLFGYGRIIYHFLTAEKVSLSTDDINMNYCKITYILGTISPHNIHKI